jgi:prepilin-type N-terminal cleavage/methylation domain-containing protein
MQDKARARMMPRMTRCSNDQSISLTPRAGFTLIEVLVALAITSVIIAALYSTFFLSRRAIDAVDESLVRLQECRAVLDGMRREIESALYQKGKPYTVFKLSDRDFYGKQASELSFTAFSPVIPGLARITYSVKEHEGRLTLRKKVISASAQPVGTESMELMEDIREFIVEAGYSGKWVRTWDSGLSNSIPDEIRVSVTVVTKKEEAPFTVSDMARTKIGIGKIL